MTFRIVLILGTLLLTASCGGGGGSSSAATGTVPAASTTVGLFIDSAVQGLTYQSTSTAGLTESDGSFDYVPGETVTFSIGPINLGSTPGDDYVSPLDLVQNAAGYKDSHVLAIASLLQSLDKDGDPANGISVTTGIAEQIVAQLGVPTLNLSNYNDVPAFYLALQQVITLQGLTYVGPDKAAVHLFQSLTSLMEVTPAFNPDWVPVGIFTSASECSQCHAARPGDSTMRLPEGDVSGEDISPSHDWQHSVMAHAFDDPYFQAVLQEESTHEFPDLASLIEDRCLTCHAPMGRTHANKTNTGLDADGNYRYEQAELDQHGREGVSCTLCHQVAATTMDATGNPVVGSDSFSGAFSIEDNRIIYGPYLDVSQGPMQSQVNYTPQFGYQVTDSGHCGTCHVVRTPVMDVNTGQPKAPAAEFLEQGTYFEWENSIYDKSSDPNEKRRCQDCHMPTPTDTYQTSIATRPPGQATRTPYSQHKLFGGNTHVLEMLKEFRTVLGIEDATSIAGFEEKIGETRAFLEQESARISIDRISETAGTLAIDVTVTNLTGHKLPSGYPSRRAWLHLAVKNGAGQIIFESGAPTNDGRISTDIDAGSDNCLQVNKPANFDNTGCFEPHRDQIDDPSRIAIYESVLGDTNGNINHVLLYASDYLKDNRLPPRGFTNAGSIDDIAIELGGVIDMNFNSEGIEGGSGTDTVHYRIPVSSQIGPYSVDARFLYQTIRPSFVHSLHGDSGRVARFKTMYQMITPEIKELASASASQ